MCREIRERINVRELQMRLGLKVKTAWVLPGGGLERAIWRSLARDSANGGVAYISAEAIAPTGIAGTEHGVSALALLGDLGDIDPSDQHSLAIEDRPGPVDPLLSNPERERLESLIMDEVKAGTPCRISIRRTKKQSPHEAFRNSRSKISRYAHDSWK